MTTVQFDGSWLSGRGRLSPDDLQAITFPATRLGRRGYEEEPVRAFLRLVHAEFTRLTSERTSLWQEVQRLRRRILAGQDPPDPRAVLILAQAQQRSAMILDDAQARAREAAVTALDHPLPPQTSHQQQAAAAELAYLRTYTDAYRSHLRAYTEGILLGIEEWERNVCPGQR